MKQSYRHKNYEILNLIGYGLAKFDNDFIREFNFSTKSSFYKFCVENGVAEQVGVVKNRMDLFDPFFPNDRKGWWQKGNTYIHRKYLIDSLFGNEFVKEYADIVKLYLKNNFQIDGFQFDIKPIVKSRFKKLQETGLEAELYFIHNYKTIDIFRNATLEDARLFGDGYDFQLKTSTDFFVSEIKGIREREGKFRLTENEYNKALEYKDKYIISLVLNLNNVPTFLNIENPLKNLKFQERIVKSREIKEYHLEKNIC